LLWRGAESISPFSKPCRFLATAGRRATLKARHHANEQTCRQEETAVYRRLVLPCAVVIGAMATASATRAADPDRCQGLSRRFEIAKPQITAMEVSLTLFSAVDANCIDLATKLLDQGASVDARDRLGARPLSHAAKSGHLAMVDLLLTRGAPIDARNLAGATALYFAAEGSHISIAQRLIERGADVKLTGRSGISPIAAAAFAGNDVIVEALLAHGADARAPDETGKPPIVYAAAGARLDIVQRLLARNIDINARYPNELTLLMWASGPHEHAPEAQAVVLVGYLLDQGAHIDDRDDRGRTALMIAAEGGHAEIANLLLERGADPSLRDKAGKRAADLAVLSALRERLTPR
jgi:ankyrin repeat protein